MGDRTKSTGVPVRFGGRLLSDYDASIGSATALAASQKYVKEFEHHRKTGRGLLFLGPPGRGKSMASCMVLNEAVRMGYSGYYTTLVGYLKRIQSTFDLKSAWEKMGDQDAYDEWQETRRVVMAMRNDVELLVIDDVGKEHLTGTRFAQDEFDFLLRHRFDRGLPTVASANSPVTEWAERYSESMQSFVHEAFEMVVVEGEDVRRARR